MAERIGGCAFCLFVAGLILLFARFPRLRPRWGSGSGPLDRLNSAPMSLASCIAGAAGFLLIGILWAMNNWLLPDHATKSVIGVIFGVMGTFCMFDYWGAGKLPPS
ncbi:MAG TPA: hypothetical protein VGI81_05145 [Tepidisphaeraceae bacterium]|jgi:hypothetical protein